MSDRSDQQRFEYKPEEIGSNPATCNKEHLEKAPRRRKEKIWKV